VPGSKWRTREVVVEVNLAQDRSEPDRWQRVKLLYVRGVNLDTNQTPAKRDWALFLSTDHQMSVASLAYLFYEVKCGLLIDPWDRLFWIWNA